MNVDQLQESLQVFHAEHIKLKKIVQDQADKISVLEKAREGTDKLVRQNFLKAEKEL
jgi:hypothetical protein